MDGPSFLIGQVIVNAITIAAMINVVLLIVAYLVYFERKISAYIQDRLGPNRVGFDFGQPWLSFLRGCIGLGQPLADGLKFFVKEDYTPARVDKVLFTLAPAICIVPAMIGFIIIPWGGVWTMPDFTIPLVGWHIAGGPVYVTGAHLSVGIIYLLAVGAIGVYGVTLGGWASNNKFSFLGSLRATAQMISYEIPMGLALLCVLLVVGSLLPDRIARFQHDHGWLVFHMPLAALVFFIAILAEANRAPFDNAECEQELVGGYHTEYSSMRFALFFMAEYSHLTTSSAFLVLLFFGGYDLAFLPFLPSIPLLSPTDTTFLAVLAKVAVYVVKVVLTVCFTMVVRWTIPRLRYDQVMMMAWQQVIPVSLALVVVTSVLVNFDQRTLVPLLLANVGVIALALGIQPLIPRSNANRRIPLYGSRFSPMPGEIVATAPSDAMALADHPVHAAAVKVKA